MLLFSVWIKSAEDTESPCVTQSVEGRFQMNCQIALMGFSRCIVHCRIKDPPRYRIAEKFNEDK